VARGVLVIRFFYPLVVRRAILSVDGSSSSVASAVLSGIRDSLFADKLSLRNFSWETSGKNRAANWRSVPLPLLSAPMLIASKCHSPLWARFFKSKGQRSDLPPAVLYCRSHHPHVVAIKGSLKNGFLLFFLRLVSPVPCNTLGIVLYTWKLLIPYRCR